MWELGVLALAMLALLVVARMTFGIVSRIEGYSLTYETVENDNQAVGIRYATFLLAVIVSFLGILHPSGVSLAEDLNIIAGYGLLSISLLVVSRWVNDYLILYDFGNNKEVIGEKNTAVAIVEGGTYMATAFIMAGALCGWEGGFWVSLIWFGIGQVFLIGLALLYRLCMRGVFKALDECNNACGISFAGFLLSGGIAMGAAVAGPFTGWSNDLGAILAYLGCWLILMSVVHFVLNFCVLPSSHLRKEIMTDRNFGAGMIESVVFLATTLFYTKVW